MTVVKPVNRLAETSSAIATASVPDLPRLRRSAVPKHEPRPASRVLDWQQTVTAAHIQGTLALTLPDETEPGDEAQPQSKPSPTTARQPAHSGLLPEPKAWASSFVQAAMEVAGGLRSAGQLVRWTTPEVHALLVRRGALTARARRGVSASSKPRLRALIACAPGPGICEISAVVSDPDRVRAVAFRMEGLHGRWRVTALEIG